MNVEDYGIWIKATIGGREERWPLIEGVTDLSKTIWSFGAIELKVYKNGRWWITAKFISGSKWIVSTGIRRATTKHRLDKMVTIQEMLENVKPWIFDKKV